MVADALSGTDNHVLQGGSVDPWLDISGLGGDGVGGLAGLRGSGLVDGDDPELVLGALGEAGHAADGPGSGCLASHLPDSELGLLLNDPLGDCGAAVVLRGLPFQVDRVRTPVGGERLA